MDASCVAPTLAKVPLEDHPLRHVLACPETGQSLHADGGDLITPDGAHRYPVLRGIPRFVGSDFYVDSFSFEWNVHKRTQLDTYREDNSSTDVFQQKTGLTPEQVRGKLVLDAGVGAGRFSDTLLRWGARVVGVDLSYAVEAAYENFGHRPQALICQADIGRLPFRPETFDYIISIGVLHHTPCTRKYFSCLPKFLKPGGEIAIWVYPNEGDYVTRNAWIPFTNRIPDRMFYSFCKVLVNWASRWPKHPLLNWWRRVFPFSDQGLGLENDILDTFDGYSPRYHGIHSPEEVEGWFREAGLVGVRRLPWNTAVRGRRAA
jgi:SAM-dependent methyltransferase